MRLFGRSATSLVNALNKSPSVMLLGADASFSPAADCSGFSYALNLTGSHIIKCLNLTESVLYKCLNLTKTVLVKCQNLPESVLYSHKDFTFCAEFSGSALEMPGNNCPGCIEQGRHDLRRAYICQCRRNQNHIKNPQNPAYERRLGAW